MNALLTIDLKDSIPNRMERSKEAEQYNLYECDFCAMSFNSKTSRMAHMIEHFERKHCKSCDKQLIRFGNDWYVQHTVDNCAESSCDVDWNSEDERDLEHFMQTIEDDLASDGSSDESGSSFSLPSDCDQANGADNFNDDFINEMRSPHEKVSEGKSELGNASSLNKNTIEMRLEEIVEPIVPKETEEGFQLLGDNATYKILATQTNDVSEAPTQPKRPKRKFLCNICKKSLTTREGLRAHLGTHTGPRFHCEYCGRGFNQMGHLKQHVNVHTQSRPFKCTICSRGFTYRAAVRRHMGTHTGEKKYVCTVEDCERRFTTKAAMKAHLYTGHGIVSEPQNCKVCNRFFAERKSLTKHMRTHRVVK